ncbi:MAG: cobyric acid synthase [Rhodobacteraceae bacterium]|nr:cobyric acid synthase [Paracoccaceae bacterium]
MTRTAAIMFQGTGSNVGKSLLVAGMCRALKRRGLTVRPFKPQNMSNNAAVTPDGGEIGRAQALQALACGVPPSIHMNPVLLKPESETGAQVIVQGKRLTTAKARDYAKLKPTLLKATLKSFDQLKSGIDNIVIEGAGSPAEINLRHGDIANMGFAEAANIPVILIGDIDRGGVIAQLVGTKSVISDTDAARIKGFIVNKFRGDPTLFDDGFSAIANLTGWQGIGTVPWFADSSKLPAEDALDIRSAGSGAYKIVVPQLSRMANFDDLDPLAQEPGIRVQMIKPGSALPGDADMVLIPGSKSTIGDLNFFRQQGWDIDLKAHHRRGGKILGICGGYQMLGQKIHDPDGIEGPAGSTIGLAYLDVETTMSREKQVSLVAATHIASNTAVQGYEIHIGATTGPDRTRPVMQVNGRPEGAGSADGLVQGTYLHGLFSSDSFRAAWLHSLNIASSTLNYGQSVDKTLDDLADHLEQNLDIDTILAIARS